MIFLALFISVVPVYAYLSFECKSCVCKLSAFFLDG